jgi:preprotein translocase subunit YajC
MQSLGGLLFPLLILLLFVPIFLSGRKQRRQMQEMQQLQSALSVGDVVTTTSGLRGTVVDVSYEDTVDLEIAEGVVTTWVRAAVREKVAVPTESDAPEVGAGVGTGSDATATHDDETAANDAPTTAPPSLEKTSDAANDASRN